MDLLQLGKPLKIACLLNNHIQGKFDVLSLFKLNGFFIRKKCNPKGGT